MASTKNKDKSTADSAPQDKTPLMQAARQGDLAAVRTLLNDGAQVDQKDKNGRTALLYAAEAGHTDVLEFLLERKADINTVDNTSRCALMLAAEKGHAETMALLIESRADTKLTNNCGKTILMYAVQYGQTEAVRLLLARDCQPEGKDYRGRTAAWYARHTAESVPAENAAAIRALLQKEVDGRTREAKHRRIREAFRKAGQAAGGFSLKILRRLRTTFYIYAVEAVAVVAACQFCYSNTTSCVYRDSAVYMRLATMAPWRDPDKAGAIRTATGMNYYGPMQMLLEGGANPDARNRKGESAFDVLRHDGSAGYADLYNLLAHYSDEVEETYQEP